MPVTIVGAGAVGLHLAARLGATGTTVRIVTRRPRTAESLLREGVRTLDPATGARAVVGVAGSAGLDSVVGESGPLILCVRASETASIARSLAALAPRAVVASAQNDVDNEPELAEHFEEVLGLVVRQTCTVDPSGTVLATGSGRIVVGSHPTGLSESATQLAHRLERAGFDVGRSSMIGRDKWLKLFVNLLSSVNALVRRADHRSAGFVELKVRLLEEARDAFDAAGIVAASCDGRDRGVEQEIEAVRDSLASGTSFRALPLYNACWAALRDPARPLEADAYHDRIIALGQAHGVATPTQRVMREAVLEAYLNQRGPECYGTEQLLGRLATVERSS